MKIPYKHILRNLNSEPDIDEISDQLFQLGHEHDILDEIFDIDITPNRGDCLSLNGILRDLKLFYKDAKIDQATYLESIEKSDIKFTNNLKNNCTSISFLEIEIKEVPNSYNELLESYFADLKINKNNFFTDVSNFISYEIGQPTHCYDYSKFGESLKLDLLGKKTEFKTLLDKTIELNEDDMVFLNERDEVINLAGVVGGKNTACSNETKSVVVECAYFNPEAIIGKSVKYDVNSDAAHKFERNTDPSSHEYALRRFIKIVEDHAEIMKLKIFSEINDGAHDNRIKFDINKVNKILGIKINESKAIELLDLIGFKYSSDSFIEIPSYRNDVSTLNDISEEIARAIGYNNIPSDSFNISFQSNSKFNNEELKLKNLLTDNGFFEVINNPFVEFENEHAILVDNPLDSNKKFLRTNLKQSLIKNLLYNERRQHDSIKLFEISDVYTSGNKNKTRVLGLIAAGRVDNNFIDFSKKIDDQYISELLKDRIHNTSFNFVNIDRHEIGSKLKSHISYLEISIDCSLKVEYEYESNKVYEVNNKKYVQISEFPCSKRDLSFSVIDSAKFADLEKYILSFNDTLLKDVFIFDFFNNEKSNEIKVGFRFIFQSKKATIKDKDVNDVMKIIIDGALSIDSVSIPGLT